MATRTRTQISKTITRRQDGREVPLVASVASVASASVALERAGAAPPALEVSEDTSDLELAICCRLAQRQALLRA
jgi:hypothetical protein